MRSVTTKAKSPARSEHAARNVPLHGVDARLDVVLAPDGHPLGEELPPQLGVVHDVPVVRADEPPLGIEVRLRVRDGRGAERRPPELGDPPEAPQLAEAEPFGHLVDRADVLPEVDRAVRADRRGSDRVVAAIGEPRRGVGQDAPQVALDGADETEDPAHARPLLDRIPDRCYAAPWRPSAGRREGGSGPHGRRASLFGRCVYASA